MQKKAAEQDVDYRVTKMGGMVLNIDNDKNRRFVEHCYRTAATMVNPIVDWSDDDVWDFLHYYGCESNPLYQCGNKRIGCIGCPMAGVKKRKDDFLRYPKYYDIYLRTFDKMLERLKELGKKANKWRTGEDVMEWWLEGSKCQNSSNPAMAKEIEIKYRFYRIAEKSTKRYLTTAAIRI